MALSFPASPTVGDIHTVGSRSWRWDGDIWSSKLNSESRWLQVLDDPGTSLTNWTSVDGTWGIDTYIENTDTSGWSWHLGNVYLWFERCCQSPHRTE